MEALPVLRMPTNTIRVKVAHVLAVGTATDKFAAEAVWLVTGNTPCSNRLELDTMHDMVESSGACKMQHWQLWCQSAYRALVVHVAVGVLCNMVVQGNSYRPMGIWIVGALPVRSAASITTKPIGKNTRSSVQCSFQQGSIF